jgi:hypothetical protein
MLRVPRSLPVLLSVVLPLLPVAGAQAKGPDAPARGLVWEARGRGGHAWLVGAVHAADQALYPLPEPIEQAFRASRVLVVEADVSERNDAASRRQLLARAALPAGRTLADVLPAPLVKLARERLRQFGLDPAAFDAFEPWYLALVLDMAAVMRAGADPSHGIDRHFLQAAGDREIVELEGAQFQFDMFHKLDASTQALFVRYTLEEMDEVAVELPKLFDAWRRGDEKGLERALFEPLEKHAELAGLRKTLFTDRNEGMAAKVAALLAQQKDVFVVVGAGHLLGPDGVPALLAARGFDVRRR